MQDIPILEIDCNMEFHDNQEIKDKMLDQVWPYLTSNDLMLIISCRFANLSRSSKLPNVKNFKSFIDWIKMTAGYHQRLAVRHQIQLILSALSHLPLINLAIDLATNLVTKVPKSSLPVLRRFHPNGTYPKWNNHKMPSHGRKMPLVCRPVREITASPFEKRIMIIMFLL